MRFLCVLCVLCGLGSSAIAIDREAFTFTKYDLEIRLEPEQQRALIHSIERAYKSNIEQLREARDRRLGAILRVLEQARTA